MFDWPHSLVGMCTLKCWLGSLPGDTGLRWARPNTTSTTSTLSSPSSSSSSSSSSSTPSFCSSEPSQSICSSFSSPSSCSSFLRRPGGGWAAAAQPTCYSLLPLEKLFNSSQLYPMDIMVSPKEKLWRCHLELEIIFANENSAKNLTKDNWK